MLLNEPLADHTQSSNEELSGDETLQQQEPQDRDNNDFQDALSDREKKRRRRRNVASDNARTTAHNDRQQEESRKSRSKAIIGTGEITSIKVVPKRRVQTCTGLFVSRLQPSTHADQLTRFISKAASYNVKVEKLPPKHESYSSFFIKANANDRKKLMDASIWPKGCVLKPYFE